MPRQPADEEQDARVSRLVVQLFSGFEDERGSIADLARRANLGHETVRRLRHNPGPQLRAGPSFFVVAAIANARGLSLDQIAEATFEGH
jgi:hypothetical protein